jgi:gluconolactonase
MKFVFPLTAITIALCLPALGLPTLALAQENEGNVQRSIESLDESFAELIDLDANIEVLSTGHQWTEGPVWIKNSNHLLFSDVPKNKIYKWDPKTKKTEIFMDPSGYDGEEDSGREPGSNGLLLDAESRLVVCDHGNRRVYRVENDGSKTTLVDRFDGKRFNSPNDLIIHANGDLYFTDPPYGLADESLREIEWHGVYRLKPDGKVDLLTKELDRPNGIGLSPDAKTLYVAQSDSKAAIYKSYPVKDDGTVGEGNLLFDATPLSKTDNSPGMPDGMAVDQKGNLWATGPGGVLVISPEGKLLGRILMGKATANCAFGDDGSTLYMTSSGFVCRVKTKAMGIGF